MIPATSNDQFSATLARWIGINDCDIDTIFPFVRNFPTSDLGFMARDLRVHRTLALHQRRCAMLTLARQGDAPTSTR